MESSNHPIERKDFEALIHAIGFEIEHAQVKLNALSRKERVLSEKPHLYVSVCPNIPTGGITKNAFM